MSKCIEFYYFPTKKSVEYAVEEGWSVEAAMRGFDIFEFNNTGLLEIEVIDDAYFYNDNQPCGELAARAAEVIGFCKIIPVDELPNNFFIGNTDCRYFGWVDTEENRENIRKYCEA